MEKVLIENSDGLHLIVYLNNDQIKLLDKLSIFLDISFISLSSADYEVVDLTD